MAAIIVGDVSIDASGNIRWTGDKETNRHTVLEFIQYLMDKQDDEQAAGDDLLDITVDTPFDRSTDQIMSLNTPFNIDDTFATHLYDGSVTQNSGDDIYSGLNIIGPVESGTEYMVVQSGKVLSAFWGTGINAEDSPSLVFSRHLVKSREGGADIDGKRVTVLARELGDQFRRFPVTLGTGNSVAAISNGADVFNENDDPTLEGYTTITNTEGYQSIDIDGAGTTPPDNEYYSQWTKAALLLNDVYERAKWISQRSHVADATTGSATGQDNPLEDATYDGLAQSFLSRATLELLTEARFEIKIGDSDSTGLVGSCYAELSAITGTAGTDAEPTGGVLARSEDIIVSAFTSAYEETIFKFNRFNPATGADQIDGLRLTAATDYMIVLRHDGGTATNNLEVDGSAANVDATQNMASSQSASWTPNVADIYLEVKSSPVIHGVPGEIFQGINVEVGFDGELLGGAVETEATNDELAIWGTRITYDGLTGTFNEGEYIAIYANGTSTSPKSGGEVLYDDGADLIVALENPAGSVIIATDDIIAVTSGADCNVTVVADEEYSGGSGYVLAKDDNGTDGELYLQVVTGVDPVDNNIIRSTSGAALTTYDVATASITTRTLNPEFIGTSTGSNIIGAYGIGYNKDDVGESDLFYDLSNSSRQPPNNQTFTVSGLINGEDRVLVGPRTGSALERDFYYLNTTLSGGAEVAVVVKVGGGAETVTPIKDDIPNEGDANTGLRIENDDGIYRKQAYNTVTRATNTFNITSSDYSGAQGTATYQASANNDVFVAFIDVLCNADTEAYTAKYVSTRNLFVRVRDGGGTPIKTFESTSAEFKSTPQTVAAVRTDDY